MIPKNMQGWRQLAAKTGGRTLTAQVLNALFNAAFGTTGDHYPGDYAFVKDASGRIVPATNTQAGGGYDAIFLRTNADATFYCLPPDQIISHPRAGKGRGRGVNRMADADVAALVADVLASKPDASIPPKANKGNGSKAIGQ